MPNRARILQTGVGPLNVDAIVESLGALRARGVVSLGSCGGLDASLACGSILLPENIVDAAGGRLPVSESWRARVAVALAPWADSRGGSLFTTESVLRDPEDKRLAAEGSGAVAVDMESAALRGAAERVEIPFIAMRVVLDTASDSVPASVSAGIDRAGNPTPGRLLKYLLGRPSDLPDLVRLALRLRTANAALAKAVERASEELLSPR